MNTISEGNNQPTSNYSKEFRKFFELYEFMQDYALYLDGADDLSGKAFIKEVTKVRSREFLLKVLGQIPRFLKLSLPAEEKEWFINHASIGIFSFETLQAAFDQLEEFKELLEKALESETND